ncbi:hypothetical protein PGT21_022939 [Puccinia graminis f. sp. tritici]|uniref:Tet-like 2OG-Fe(II) oxygenase domain-containing protein n=1 Tax=Puccinia graminis f. sp. tritici TaxID=56615 RepID=A0A5B0RCE8_PUCGR|nr:hypothetical protein PGT21_022939 [Puccinia graminis f. sp. tritici]KAA1123521.1 hypothetical protein PGTUg99_024299 [Puccinia graminis f. sp. tritici]
MDQNLIPTNPVLTPRSNQAEHEFSAQPVFLDPRTQKYMSHDIIDLPYTTLILDQSAPHSKIQCPKVEDINSTQEFLQAARHHIEPSQPTMILTNANRELGLFVKQTKWSEMASYEIEDIEFLTTTLVQLGRFYKDQKNSSFLDGIMKGFGWRKGYGLNGEHCGTYTPSNIETEEDYNLWKSLLLRLHRVDSIISQRFKKLAPGLFESSVKKMKSARSPSFSSSEFHQSSPLAYASNLTATWGEFYNQAHIDNDVNSISYGGWCGISQETGKPASKADGFDVKYGQFFLPGISTVVDFNAIDGWTDLFWASNYLYHQTVQSERPTDSPFTRFAFSA